MPQYDTERAQLIPTPGRVEKPHSSNPVMGYLELGTSCPVIYAQVRTGGTDFLFPDTNPPLPVSLTTPKTQWESFQHNTMFKAKADGLRRSKMTE